MGWICGGSYKCKCAFAEKEISRFTAKKRGGTKRVKLTLFIVYFYLVEVLNFGIQSVLSEESNGIVANGLQIEAVGN